MVAIFEIGFSLCYDMPAKITNNHKIPGLSLRSFLTINTYEFTKSTQAPQKNAVIYNSLLSEERRNP